MEKILVTAEEVRRENFDREIYFYTPNFMYYKNRGYQSSPEKFHNVSITGGCCALNCKHCEGKVLNAMYPANSPEKLWEFCLQLNEEGASGCLISGGCLPDGSISFESFYDIIEKIKCELDLTVIVHTGLIKSKTAERFRKAGVDTALIDIMGSDETINEIYNLDNTTKDYDASLKALQDSEIDFVPHIITGIHYGQLRGELKALQMIQEYNPSALVIIAFMPIHGTQMGGVLPPKPEDIAKVMAVARLMFPETPIALGCMRPKGEHRIKTDLLSLKSGVNAIAFPTEETIEAAKERGYNINFSAQCCSQIYSDLTCKSYDAL